MTNYKFKVTPKQRERAVKLLDRAGFQGSFLCREEEAVSIVTYEYGTYGVYNLPTADLSADLELSFDEFIERLDGTL